MKWRDFAAFYHLSVIATGIFSSVIPKEHRSMPQTFSLHSYHHIVGDPNNISNQFVFSHCSHNIISNTYASTTVHEV